MRLKAASLKNNDKLASSKYQLPRPFCIRVIICIIGPKLEVYPSLLYFCPAASLALTGQRHQKIIDKSAKELVF